MKLAKKFSFLIQAITFSTETIKIPNGPGTYTQTWTAITCLTSYTNLCTPLRANCRLSLHVSHNC